MKYIQIVFKTPKLSGKARKYSKGYRKIALCVTTTPDEPKMISNRCKTVEEVVDCSSLYYGAGVRSEGAEYAAELNTLATKLAKTKGYTLVK